MNERPEKVSLGGNEWEAMAKTSAERQKEYRSRRNDGEGDYRLNTWVSASAHFALARVAARYGVTQRALLERLVAEADQQISKSLTDEDQWDAYMRCEKPGQI